MRTKDWIPVSRQLPPAGEFVQTKIDDAGGVRNIQELKLSSGLWFGQDNMYVYYTPTHWRQTEVLNSKY